MSKETELAWAAVRECNEALKAADAILAMALPNGWHTIERAEWVEFERCLRSVAERHEFTGAADSMFGAYHRDLITDDKNGKVNAPIYDMIYEALKEHQLELTKIWEGTK